MDMALSFMILKAIHASCKKHSVQKGVKETVKIPLPCHPKITSIVYV